MAKSKIKTIKNNFDKKTAVGLTIGTIMVIVGVLLIGTGFGLIQLNVFAEDNQLELVPSEKNLTVKYYSSGELGKPGTLLTEQEYILLQESDDKYVTVKTSSYTTYPIVRTEFNVSKELNQITEVYIRAEGWSNCHSNYGFSMGIWNDKNSSWETSSENGIWEHKKSEDSYIYTTIKENINEYITEEGTIKVSIKGAADSWSSVDGVLYIDKLYIRLNLGEKEEESNATDQNGNMPPRALPGDPLPTACGDGKCEGTETYITCSQDCKVAICGNGVCDNGETYITCSSDCQSICGDGICNSKYENSINCETDCPKVIGPEKCGDGICESGETATCPKDCTISPPIKTYRGLIIGLTSMILGLGILGYIYTKGKKKK
jgi:hypothetical protein